MSTCSRPPARRAGHLSGDDYAQSVQLSMEYAPEPPFNSGRPELAPASVLADTQKRYARVHDVRDAAAERAAARLLLRVAT